ncbi:hypothetical protein CATRI_06670 [Corynebacterium atrinae]|nr:hypothetical protein CATRI_06670 [Corynebacterium atrinae]
MVVPEGVSDSVTSFRMSHEIVPPHKALMSHNTLPHAPPSHGRNIIVPRIRKADVPGHRSTHYEHAVWTSIRRGHGNVKASR